jgi:hypothetical protein
MITVQAAVRRSTPRPAADRRMRAVRVRSMSIVAVADLFGVSGRRHELIAALMSEEREAAEQPGCIRYLFAATVADAD